MIGYYGNEKATLETLDKVGEVVIEQKNLA